LNIRDFRTLFVVCGFVLIFFAMSPTLNLVFPFYADESFSEISVLDQNRIAKAYPFNVAINQEERIYVKVNNHMGESSYYRIYVKFRNQTQSFPIDNEPSSLPPIYEFRVFLLDGGTLEQEVKFRFLETVHDDDTFQIKSLRINNVVLESDFISKWDSKYNGFYFQLFFELWLYDVKLDSFDYYDRGFVGIWLNMTV
jgi:hypothetical protein